MSRRNLEKIQIFSSFDLSSDSCEKLNMDTMAKKSIQMLNVFNDAITKMEHGKQQETVNAALTMFFMADANGKRSHIRLFRDIRDGIYKIVPQEAGRPALLYQRSSEDDVWLKKNGSDGL